MIQRNDLENAKIKPKISGKIKIFYLRVLLHHHTNGSLLLYMYHYIYGDVYVCVCVRILPVGYFLKNWYYCCYSFIIIFTAYC